MTHVESLPTKQKHLIGVGAAIAAGCQPCTRSFVEAAKSAGACDRGVRFALESGLGERQAANAAMLGFADDHFARPELDETFRAERKLIAVLIGVAAAVAAAKAGLLEGRLQAARDAGATDEQLRVAVQIGRTARKGAETAVDELLRDSLRIPAADCSDGKAAERSAGGCGCAASP